MKLTTFTFTLCAVTSIYTMTRDQMRAGLRLVTLIGVVAACTVTARAQDISFHHYRHGTGPLVIIAGASTETVQQFNPRWRGQGTRFVVSRNWWIPYPADWPLYDNGVRWVIANYAIDANLDGVPDYYQFDYNADGHVDSTDLSYFEREYGAKWDLSDFAAVGLIFNDRR